MLMTVYSSEYEDTFPDMALHWWEVRIKMMKMMRIALPLSLHSLVYRSFFTAPDKISDRSLFIDGKHKHERRAFLIF